MYETLWSLHSIKNREAYREIFSHTGRFGMCLFFCTCRRCISCTVLSLSCNTRCCTPATYAPVRLEPLWGTCLQCRLLSFRFLHVLAYKINITRRSVSHGAEISHPHKASRCVMRNKASMQWSLLKIKLDISSILAPLSILCLFLSNTSQHLV